MNLLLLQTAALFVLALGVWLARYVNTTHSLSHAAKSMLAACELPPPSEFVSQELPPSLAWNEHCDSAHIKSLLWFLELKCKYMPACMASEFGVPVSVGYLPARKLFIVNPRLLHSDAGTLIECDDEVGGKRVVHHRPFSVEAEFLDESLAPSKAVFTNRESCLVQLMVHTMDHGVA
jgi:hypothetical protein